MTEHRLTPDDATDSHARGTKPSLRERAGRAAGWLGSPWFAAAAWLRSARALHPRGTVYVATVSACSGPGQALGERLAGGALVRCSGALWKRTRAWPEVLGVAVRFGGTRLPLAEAAPEDQDLLFATVRTPWLLGIAPLLTDGSDYLHDDYFAVSPFATPELGEVYFRLRPRHPTASNGSRYLRLATAVRYRDARFALQARLAGQHEWFDVAIIELVETAILDSSALRFSAFRTGLGVVPRGFVHALRPGAYAGSRWGSTRRRRAPAV